MIIPITLSSASTSFSSSANPKLPPSLVKISNDETMLIELQGSLEVELNDPSERNGKLVGQLKMDDVTNKPTLLIGHHLLEGKIAALPKPYAILVRTGATRATTTTEPGAIMHRSSTKGNKNADQTQPDSDVELLDEVGSMAMAVESHTTQGPEFSREEDDAELEESGSGAGWAIAGIVKKKIVFSKRPMPVIGRK